MLVLRCAASTDVEIFTSSKILVHVHRRGRLNGHYGVGVVECLGGERKINNIMSIDTDVGAWTE